MKKSNPSKKNVCRGVPKWLDVQTKKERSKEQEKNIANDLGGKVQPGSGNQSLKPGDIISENFLVEAKFTDKKSFRVDDKLIEKIKQESRSVGKEWAIVMEISGRQVVVIDYNSFLQLNGG